MDKNQTQKMIEDSKEMDDDEVYNLFLKNINAEIERSIEEVMEKKGLTASKVLEDYNLLMNKALFISSMRRNEL